ncbi:hypothetical protein LXL04_002944 [Taraxacum kok-saghyz]
MEVNENRRTKDEGVDEESMEANTISGNVVGSSSDPTKDKENMKEVGTTQGLAKDRGGQMKCQGGRENELLPMEMKQLLRSFFCLDFKYAGFHWRWQNTSFWSDRWHAKGILKKVYSRLFPLEDKKDAGNRLTSGLGEQRLELAVRGRKLVIWKEILKSKDKWVLPNAPNGLYTTAWLRGCLEVYNTMGCSFQNYRLKWIPKRENIFFWRLSKVRLPVRETLNSIRMDIPSILCPLCNSGNETINHLGAVVGKSDPPIFRILVTASIGFKTIPENSKAKKHQEGVWENRNNLIFKNYQMEKEAIFRKVQNRAFLWITSRSQKISLEWTTWLAKPF